MSPSFITECRYDVPEDPDWEARRRLLSSLGLEQDRPMPQLDDLARELAHDTSALTGRPDGFFAFVNIMKMGYQYFAGLYLPARRGIGEEPAAHAGVPPEARFMPRTEGWCVYTVHKSKALPLDDVFDRPRWRANGAVRKLGARTYLGAPLTDRRTQITFGTVAVVGKEQTEWRTEDVQFIKNYASRGLERIYGLSGADAR